MGLCGGAGVGGGGVEERENKRNEVHGLDWCSVVFRSLIEEGNDKHSLHITRRLLKYIYIQIELVLVCLMCSVCI